MVLGLGVYFGYQWYTQRQNAKGWVALHKAEQEPEDKRWDALAKFYDGYSSHRPGLFAATTLADHYFDLAKKADAGGKADDLKANAEKAAEWYAKAVNHSGLTPNEKQLLIIQKGGALEISGKLDEAQSEYAKASDISTGVATPYALLCLGRVWELKKDQAKAAEIYGKVATEFPETQYGTMAKGHLRRLKSPLFNDAKKS